MSVTAASLMVEVGGETGGAEGAIDRVDNRINAFAQQATQYGAILTAGVTLPLVGIATAAGKSAMEYETTMNIFQATSSATASQMVAVATRAKELGASLDLPGASATDATEAMLELARAGLSVEESMSAAKGVLALAATEGMATGRAAEITAAALNAFNLAGDQATYVADLLAGSANASAASVADMGDAFNQAAALAGVAGMGIDELTTQLALMANAGIKGGDAGTSIKSMLMALQSPTDQARALMRDLGVSVYDTAGNMLSTRDIIGQFSSSMATLTQEQRDQALASIFGSDAVRAANIVLLGGVDAYDSMHTAVTKTGAATELAAARMKGAAGAIEGLQSAVETFLLGQAERFNGYIAQAAGLLSELVTWVSTLDQSYLDAGLAALAVAAAAGPLLVVLGTLAGAIAFVLSPIGLLIVGVAALAAAFTANFGGIRDIVTNAINGLVPILDNLRNYFMFIVEDGDYLNDFLSNLPGPIQGITLAIGQFVAGALDFGAAIRDALPLVQDLINFLVMPIGSDAVYQAISGTQLLLARLGADIDFFGKVLAPVRQAIQAFFDAIRAAATGDLSGAFEKLLEAGYAVQAAFDGLWVRIQPILIDIGIQLATQVVAWGMAFVGWIAPMIPQVITELQQLIDVVVPWAREQVGALLAAVGEWGQAFVAWVVPAVQNAMVVYPDILRSILDFVAGAVGPILSQLGLWAIQFVQWVYPMIPDLLIGLAAVGATIIVFLGETLGVIVEKLLQWAWAFLKWIGENVLPKLIPELQRLQDMLFTWIAEAAVGIVRTLQSWQDAFLNWIVNGVLPFIGAELQKISNRLATWIQTASDTLATQANAIGKSIVDGIWAGLLAAWASFISNVQGLVDQLPPAVKAALGIASPSKVFAEAVGKPIVDGIAMGIRENMNVAVDAARAAVRAVVQETSAGVTMPILLGAGGRAVPMPTLGSIGAGGGAGAVPISREVHIHNDNKFEVRQPLDALRTVNELACMNDRLSRGVTV